MLCYLPVFLRVNMSYSGYKLYKIDLVWWLEGNSS